VYTFKISSRNAAWKLILDGNHSNQAQCSLFVMAIVKIHITYKQKIVYRRFK
jgi:hypothetical protein